MSTVPSDRSELLAQLTKAGALVGLSNRDGWARLVLDYGDACVLAIVDELHADTGQPVNVAVVSKRCEAEKKQKQDEADDAAEDAAMDRQIARGGAPLPVARAPVAKGTTAVVVSKPASVAAATDAHPIQPAEITPNQEVIVPKMSIGPQHSKSLLKNIEDELARRGITAKSAAVEMGVGVTAISMWRKTNAIGTSAAEKAEAWLSASAKKSGDQPADDQAETVAIERKTTRKSKGGGKKRVDAEPAIILPSGNLIERGEHLVQRLTEFGCEGYAATVSELVEKWRAVRSALSA